MMGIAESILSYAEGLTHPTSETQRSELRGIEPAVIEYSLDNCWIIQKVTRVVSHGRRYYQFMILKRLLRVFYILAID